MNDAPDASGGLRLRCLEEAAPRPDHDARPIAISRPRLPSFDRLAPYAAAIDESRFYTNFGAMHERLRGRLAAHFGIGVNNAALACSGTAGLTGLILGVAGRAGPARPLCVCPSYTFVGTAAAVQSCGYQPYLADIDPGTWSLDPEAVAQLPRLDEVALVAVVAPYGRMVDLRGWQAFTDRTGIPVVVDAAACFDTLDPAALRATRVPVVVSLHATKTLSTAEGGLLLCGDAAPIGKATTALNFGFEIGRVSVAPSINGKLSEYHAIVGLAEMDGWAAKRAAFLRVASLYEAAAAEAGIGAQIVVTARHAAPYAHFLARDAAEAERACALLDARHIEWRRWYGVGLHVQPAFRDCPATTLPATVDLAARLVSLPFHLDLDEGDVGRVLATLREAVANGRTA